MVGLMISVDQCSHYREVIETLLSVETKEGTQRYAYEAHCSKYWPVHIFHVSTTKPVFYTDNLNYTFLNIKISCQWTRFSL